LSRNFAEYSKIIQEARLMLTAGGLEGNSRFLKESRLFEETETASWSKRNWKYL